jgi:hypothetical protein
MDAYNTDVRPLLAELREDAGLDPDPIAAYRAAATRRRSSPSGSAAAGRMGRVRIASAPRSGHAARAQQPLGADPRNTNYAGGNTSAKGTETDPVTGEPVELLWVKGSGGDLGTLTEAGLAVLRLDRLRALTGVYPGVEREDEMVAAFDYCLHGKGGAAPSIDTAMHGLVDAAARRPPAPRLRHRARDRRRRRGADQGVLRRPGGLGAVAPARLPARPGHRRRQAGQPAGDRRASSAGTASPRGATLSDECEANSLEIIARRGVPRRARQGRAVRPVVHGHEPCPRPNAAPAPPRSPGDPRPRLHRPPQVGHFTDSDVVLDFWPRRAPALAALGTSCPDHFLRTKVQAAGARPAAGRAARRGRSPGSRSCTPPTAPTTGLLRAARHPRTQPAMRGADPAIVLVPGRRHVQLRQGQADRPGRRRVLRQRDQRDARRRGGLDLRADRRGGEVPHRVLGARRGQAAADAEAEAARHPDRARDRRRLGHRQGDRAAARRRGRLRRRRRPRRGAAPGRGRRDRRAADVAIAVTADVTDEDAVAAAFDDAVLAFGGVDLVVNNAGLSISKPLLETTEADWDLQHDVMAKGSFLVSREARGS